MACPRSSSRFQAQAALSAAQQEAAEQRRGRRHAEEAHSSGGFCLGHKSSHGLPRRLRGQKPFDSWLRIKWILLPEIQRVWFLYCLQTPFLPPESCRLPHWTVFPSNHHSEKEEENELVQTAVYMSRVNFG